MPAAHSSRSGKLKKPICTLRSRTDHTCLLVDKCVYLTYTVIFAINIFQIEAILALAVVAAKGVHALSVVWTEVFPSDAFINI